MALLPYIIAAVILLVFLYIAWKITKKLIINSIIGLILLGILYFIYGATYFANWLAVFVITVIFGIPGILVILVLKYLFRIMI